MDFYELFGFLTILKESIKFLLKNGRLMAYVAIFSVALSSSLFMLFNYSLKTVLVDMFVTYMQVFMPNPGSFNMPGPNSSGTTDPNSFTTPGFDPTQITDLMGHFRRDYALILAVQGSFLLCLFTISLFSTIATVLVSSLSYSANTLSLVDLILRIGTSWRRPMITSFYVSALAIGYCFTVVMLVSPLLVYPNSTTYWLAILLGIMACIFYIYLVVAWILAVVVSVVDESCHGVHALAKAAALVKGKRLHGFLFNACLNLVVLVIFVLSNRGFANPTLYGLLILNVSYLVKHLLVVAYTVLYFDCKKHHGEEIELNGGLQYMKLSAAQLASDMP